MKNKNGFTLIELLVVVAIISLLSSIVFASLSSARAKGTDAAIKENLSTIRSQAEIIYENTGNFDSVCGINHIPRDPIIATAMSSAIKAGGDGDCMPIVTSHVGVTGWHFWASLKSTPGYALCVDSTGAFNKIQSSEFEGGVSRMGSGCPDS